MDPVNSIEPDDHTIQDAFDRRRESVIGLGRVEIRQPVGKRTAHAKPSAHASRQGSQAAALIEMEKGRSLQGTDVLEPIRINALVAFFSGNFAPARARLEEVSRLSSQPIGDTYLALAYYYSGSADRSRTMLQSLAESRSATTAARAGAALAGVLAAQGARDTARLHLERVLELGYRDHHVAYSLGAAYAQLGDMTAADKWLRTAADTGFPCLPFFERDPLLAPIRGRPAFSDLLGYVRARRDLSLSGH